MCTTTRPRPPVTQVGVAQARANAEKRAAVTTRLPAVFSALRERMDAFRVQAGHTDTAEIGPPRTFSERQRARIGGDLQ